MPSLMDLDHDLDDNRNSEEPHSNSFLDLPAELRNQIYQIALTSDEPLDASHHSLRQPSLALVCRQMRDESLAWFYTRNLFRLSVCNGNLSGLVGFAVRTPAPALWMLRDWGCLQVSTKYTSIFDMPVSQSAMEWRQPFTKTSEPAMNFLLEQHMRRDSPMKDAETGRMLLDWLLQPDVLDKLRQERRMGPSFTDIHMLKMRTDAQLQSVGYHLC